MIQEVEREPIDLFYEDFTVIATTKDHSLIGKACSCLFTKLSLSASSTQLLALLDMTESDDLTLLFIPSQSDHCKN